MAVINWNEKKALPPEEVKPEIAKLQQELAAQLAYNIQLESTVLELADLIFMMGV